MNHSDCVQPHPDGTALTVWVVPGAKRTQVVGYHGGALRVRVAARPEKGQANRAVIDLLEDLLGARLRLMSGAGSRRKRLVVVGVPPPEVSARLAQIAN